MAFKARLTGASLAGKAIGTIGIRFGALGLQFVGSILIARILGVEQFGIYSYAFTWITIVGALLGLGLEHLAIREIPRFVTHGEHDTLRGLIFTWSLSVLTFAAIFYVIFIALNSLNFINFQVVKEVLLLAALTHALFLGVSSILIGFQKIVRAQFLDSVVRQSLYLGALIAIYLSGVSLSPSIIIGTSVATSVPILILMAWLIRREINQAGPTVRIRRKYMVGLWLSSSLPLLVSALATQLQTNVDILTLGVLADEADVGRYRAASRGADLALIANGLVIQVLGPMLSRALARNDREEAQKLISQCALMSAALGLSICAFLGLFSKFYLGLFGSDFTSASTAMHILLLSQVVAILTGPSGTTLIMLGHEKSVLVVNALSLVLNLALNILLIPIWGILGAAIATLAAVTAMEIGLMILQIRWGGFSPTILTPLKQMIGRSNDKAA